MEDDQNQNIPDCSDHRHFRSPLLNKGSTEQKFFFTDNKIPFKNSTNMDINIISTYSDLKPQGPNHSKLLFNNENKSME